jgi:MFS family permease
MADRGTDPGVAPVTATVRSVERTYLLLTLLTTLAASFIWGVNTLFLLDAGLSNAEAFAANAFFSLGQVIFEVPTGVIADTRGRRFSFLLGAATLLASTVLYLVMWDLAAPFWGWALASALLGLGFTFFSGATEAWLVDALVASGDTRDLEVVFGRAQIVSGGAMLAGSVLGGVIAQFTDLGAPYVVRSVLLGVTVVVAWRFMHDIGFTPDRESSAATAVRTVVTSSIEGGFGNPPVRWLMLAAPFIGGVSFYVFYAAQPYLLEIYGDPNAYSIAGITAALVAGSQIAGGLLVNRVRRFFRRRTTALIEGGAASVAALALLGTVPVFWIAILSLAAWGLLGALQQPMRRAYLNGLIRSDQRATVLSFDSLMSSAGGVVIQPTLGRVADVSGYAASYVVAAGIQALAIPFAILARREKAHSDPILRPVPAEPHEHD